MASILKFHSKAAASGTAAKNTQATSSSETGLSETARAAARSSTTGLAGFNLDDFADVGRRQLDGSRAAAEKIIAAAQTQASEVLAKARQEGYDAGLASASVDNEATIKAASEKRAKEQLALIHKAVDDLYRAHEEWMDEYAQSLTTMALSAAERIVRAKLESEKTILVRWAEEAIKSTRAASKLTMAVHPEMLAELGTLLDDLVASPEYPTNTHVVPDETLEMTDVVVRQDGGEIQAGLRTQLERLSEMLG